MNIEVLKHSTAGSLAGTVDFPDVVHSLVAEGVESYYADLVRMEKSFYAPDGETHVEKMDFPALPVGQEFDQTEVMSAIRASQAGTQKYPEFLHRAIGAGTTSYMVFLTGRKAIYFGRKGEFHVENFPGAKN
jgi:uncharacterized protein YbcV (DUF1398 family)